MSLVLTLQLGPEGSQMWRAELASASTLHPGPLPPIQSHRDSGAPLLRLPCLVSRELHQHPLKISGADQRQKGEPNKLMFYHLKTRRFAAS